MNRMEEYKELMQELEQPVLGLEETLDRAMQRVARRKVRRRRIICSVVGFVASFTIFVMLVNFCTPIAYACSKVPILRALAEAVTFSRSLSDAVDNEYVQSLYLTQKDGDVAASVEYLIVDQKQVNVFFRLYSDVYHELSVYPTILSVDGKRPEACSYGLNNWDVPNGELQSITIDFVDRNVPDSLRLQLDVRDLGDAYNEAIVPAAPENSLDSMFAENIPEESDYIAHFDFLLEFDSEFTATGKLFPINQTVVLEGQEIAFTNMEVYPTHLRVDVVDSPDNTAWLKTLYFYIETDWGMKFDTVSNGITATGSPDSPTMTSFRTDSAYFYDAKHLKIVVTGAEWLNKDMEKIHVNLKTGEIGQLPEGVELHSITRETGGWLLEFEAAYRKPNHQHQLFASKFYDESGKEYDINSWSTTVGDKFKDGEATHFLSTFPLKDYPYEEVWLCPNYSHVWTADKPISLIVQ